MQCSSFNFFIFISSPYVLHFIPLSEYHISDLYHRFLILNKNYEGGIIQVETIRNCIFSIKYSFGPHHIHNCLNNHLNLIEILEIFSTIFSFIVIEQLTN